MDAAAKRIAAWRGAASGHALTIALCQQLLDGHGAVRVHGGGFAGTALAFVPNNRFEQFKDKIDAAIGVNAVHKLIIQ